MNARRDPEALSKRLALYVITPEDLGPRELHRLDSLLNAGLGVVQFRDKSNSPARLQLALHVRESCRRNSALFIVNDDVKLAKEVEADGVHLGPDDLSPPEARQLLGPDALIGVSAGTSERLAPQLLREADYIGVGAIYDARGSKLDANHGRGVAALQEARAAVGALPIVAIGGIDATNAAACFKAGADGVAMIRGAFGKEPAADFVRSVFALRDRVRGNED